MEKFFDFLYFLVGSICVVRIVKYVCGVCIAKYHYDTEENEEEE